MTTLWHVTSNAVEDVIIPPLKSKIKPDEVFPECTANSDELFQCRTSSKIQKKQQSRSSVGANI
eukprot:14399021-Ditylum_brightwellii.AAC.1